MKQEKMWKKQGGFFLTPYVCDLLASIEWTSESDYLFYSKRFSRGAITQINFLYRRIGLSKK